MSEVVDAGAMKRSASTCTGMMQEARLFERRAQDLFLEGLVKGTSHLALGQEAVAAGFAAALRTDDSSSARIAVTCTRCSAARRWAR